MASLLPRPPRPQTKKSVTETPDKSAAQRVWVLRGDQPIAIPVTVGQSDGRMTEVTGADLAAGMPVITARLSATP